MILANGGLEAWIELSSEHTSRQVAGGWEADVTADS